MLLPGFLCLVLVVVTSVSAYIPALPTNDTNIAIAGGLNVTDVSKLHLQWSNGSDWENVSYQLAGNGSQGISKGALVHFSEEPVNNDTAPTSTPWIALVACDANATNQSLVDDIFTLARDKGAVAALLFSLYSTACVINPEYTDPDTFDQVFDIFSTKSLISSHIIEYQFGQLGAKNESLYGSYGSKWLNESGTDINSTIASNTPVAPGYLFATLQAYNATGDTTNPDSTDGGGAGNTNSANGNNTPNTALAMIILYACTGCVSALFIVVIISGAVRAIRHPERYGPRAARHAGGEPGQSRARGLTRAILDTFPIVKFGSSTPNNAPAQPNPDKDVGASDTSATDVVDSQVAAMEMAEWEVVDARARPISTVLSRVGQRRVEEDVYKPDDAQPRASGSRDSPQFDHTNTLHQADIGSPRADATRYPTNLSEDPSRNTAPMDRDDVVPAAIGRETCPICIVDFEEGDDLRLLPCEGKHRFHQQCVDPWLLELSSSCPICRHDFLALETMLSVEPDDDVAPRPWVQGGSPITHGNRFSRYLRFANNRRNHRDRREEPDPTDPPMPIAPETSM